MAIYNYISSKNILAKVMRDSNIQRTDWINDAVEWIGEALDAIGSFAQTESASKVLKTYNHSAPLPEGLISIGAVFYGKSNQDETEAPTREDLNYLLPYGDPDGHPAFVEEDPDHPTGVDLSLNNDVFKDESESWLLSGGYIKTSFEEDWILISYQKVLTDGDGFPMVPDNYSFSQALYWYIIYKLMESGLKHPSGINYFQAEERWLKYCRQARNKAAMPDYAQARRFKDIWVSLLPVRRYETEKEASAVDADNLVADIFQRYTINEG